MASILINTNSSVRLFITNEKSYAKTPGGKKFSCTCCKTYKYAPALSHHQKCCGKAVPKVSRQMCGKMFKCVKYL